MKQLADVINKDYENREIKLICVLKGGIFALCELSKYIKVPVKLDFMCVSSYEDNTSSSGRVRIVKDLDQNIEGEDVLIVEDIIDSGRTLTYLFEILKARKPNSIRLCTLLDKPDRRVPEADIKVDYTGFTIPDEFVVGYGLDYAQKYRNLPYIGVVKFDDK
ncbi:MAG: hypoxanthine phosphoribosyltransferase [Lachnospiraceae bacterium]|nr:hypoxanthine phosphoribosyltransferase [Lachnospiraceae bacterium]